MKKVSVIIPTYKRSKYLLRAINSVLCQTYKTIELIIVDDNNEDSEFRRENENRLKELIDQNKIIYIKHKKNMNGAAARNSGLKIATGDYITFLDDDDFFIKDRIEIIINEMEKEENIQYNAAYTSMLKVRNKKCINYRVANKSGNFAFETLSQQSIFGTGSNMFFRRKTIDEIGNFDEKFFRFQDLEYMARFFKNNNILAINKMLVVKCEEDKINVPNFEKLYTAKKLFIDKFINDINSFNDKSNTILYNIYKELYILSSSNVEEKKALSLLCQYSKISLKDKLIHKYYKSSQKYFICKTFDGIIRNIRCKLKFSKSTRKYVFDYINSTE